ncbi:MAG TPA: antitoxin [Bdellovibrionota bacterium]|nr:antitoxin [Bdellovibrionota bacterium]
MGRTTINIDEPVLRDVRRLQRRLKRPLGQLISELLAQALGRPAGPPPKKSSWKWISRSMNSRVNLADKELVWRLTENKS